MLILQLDAVLLDGDSEGRRIKDVKDKFCADNGRGRHHHILRNVILSPVTQCYSLMHELLQVINQSQLIKFADPHSMHCMRYTQIQYQALLV